MSYGPKGSRGSPIRRQRRDGLPALRRFFNTGPDGSFPFCDGRLVALNGPTFRLLVAPVQLVQDLAHVIAMVSHSQSAFNQIGNPLRGPQLRPVSMRHGPFGQETNESLFLLRSQPGWPA